jgi:SAM-dependent methyltransferase
MIGRETLDDPRADPVAVRRTLADIVRLNTLFGGTRAVVEALEPVFRRAGRDARWTLLDVGAGSGDIARAAVRVARRHGLTLTPIGIELNRTAAQAALAAGVSMIVADGSRLPLGPASVDVVVASQVLHHLPRDVAIQWIAGFDRLARRAVVLADLRRSRVAMAGVWLAAVPLGLNRMTRHDAVVSLQRGYTVAEFNAMLREAGVSAVARYRPGFRMVASWETSDISAGAVSDV